MDAPFSKIQMTQFVTNFSKFWKHKLMDYIPFPDDSVFHILKGISCENSPSIVSRNQIWRQEGHFITGNVVTVVLNDNSHRSVEK